jgi:enoyl-[acyl-carrier protein] reductase I
MGLLEGRKGLVFGVANDRSIAYHIARCAVEHGAVCGFPHLPGEKMARRVRKALESGQINDPWLMECDAGKDEDLERVFTAARDRFDTLDFVVHSIAFADREFLKVGAFADTSRAAFSQALDISAFTLVRMGHHARQAMSQGGSIVAMTYYGAQKVVPGYNVMGVAKAALECCVRYLAAELGSQGIRVNTISAGPVRTLSAMAVGGIDDMFEWVARKAPLQRNIEPEEVARSALFLLSDLSSGITGENLFVDAGYNTIGL